MFSKLRGSDLIIAVYSRIKIDRILHYAFWCALAGALLALLCGLTALLFSPWQTEREMVACLQPSVEMDCKKTAAYAAIGGGPLSLRRGVFCPFASQLRGEVMILAQNTRPDASGKDTELLVQLKTAGETKPVTAGTLLYLEEAEGVLRFSVSPTDFWIRPVVVENGDLLLEAEKSSERGQLLVRASQDLGRRVGDRFWDKSFPLFVSQLKEAQCWGVDFLIQHYGGKEHRLLQGKYKLIIGDAVYFVGPQDRLSWTGGEWEVRPQGSESRNEPLACVKSVSSRGVEIDVWDESGFQTYAVNIDLSHPSKVGMGPDYLPTSVRMRTASQVACTLGKRRLILKEGDWLLRTGTAWRKLKTPEEIDLCLQHKLRGELLIFDKIEKQQGKTVLHAHLFDEMRTQMQTLVIPILAEKKKTSGGKV